MLLTYLKEVTRPRISRCLPVSCCLLFLSGSDSASVRGEEIFINLFFNQVCKLCPVPTHIEPSLKSHLYKLTVSHLFPMNVIIFISSYRLKSQWLVESWHLKCSNNTFSIILSMAEFVVVLHSVVELYLIKWLTYAFIIYQLTYCIKVIVLSTAGRRRCLPFVCKSWMFIIRPQYWPASLYYVKAD